VWNMSNTFVGQPEPIGPRLRPLSVSMLWYVFVVHFDRCEAISNLGFRFMKQDNVPIQGMECLLGSHVLNPYL